jgi:hypothetical protein
MTRCRPDPGLRRPCEMTSNAKSAPASLGVTGWDTLPPALQGLKDGDPVLFKLNQLWTLRPTQPLVSPALPPRSAQPGAWVPITPVAWGSMALSLSRHLGLLPGVPDFLPIGQAAYILQVAHDYRDLKAGADFADIPRRATQPQRACEVRPEWVVPAGPSTPTSSSNFRTIFY